MQHRFPFVILALTLPGNMVDVNVHPAKAQVRFSDGPAVFQFVKSTVKELLNHREMIVSTGFGSVAEEARQVREAQKRAREAGKEKDVPEPFEELRRKQEAVPEPSEELRRKQEAAPVPFEELQKKQEDVPEPFEELRREHNAPGGYLEGTGQGASPYQKRYPDRAIPQNRLLMSFLIRPAVSCRKSGAGCRQVDTRIRGYSQVSEKTGLQRGKPVHQGTRSEQASSCARPAASTG